MTDRAHKQAALLLRPLCSLYFRCLYGVRIRNRNNLPTEGVVILTPNHQTYFDGPLVEYGAHRPLFYMVGKKYGDLPILGVFLRAMGSTPLTESGSANAYRAGVEILQKGHCLGIFPEGERTRDGSLQALRSGAARLALVAGAPIVPVSITGAHEVWPRGRLLLRAFRDAPESHRSESFVADFRQVGELLRKEVGAHEVCIMLGSGTLANDAIAGQLSLLKEPELVPSNDLPAEMDSRWLGARLRRAGFQISYESSYLIQRNWIQVSLMGVCSRRKLDCLLEELKESLRGAETPSVGTATS